jgi:hypothetical protein
LIMAILMDVRMWECARTRVEVLASM